MLLLLTFLQAPATPDAPARASYPPPSEEELAGHREMLRLLEDVKAKTPRQNAYLGDQPLKKLLENRAEIDEQTASQNPGFGNHWLEVACTGVRSSRSAFGTRIHAQFFDGSERRHVYCWVGTGGSFGVNPLTQHLGLGQAKEVEKLEIYWPASDTTQVFEKLPVDRRVEVVEGDAKPRIVVRTPARFGGKSGG
jgi:hypothetical protein